MADRKKSAARRTRRPAPPSIRKNRPVSARAARAARAAPAAGRESQADRKARLAKILRALKKLYPEATCALTHRSALELLVSTILSAQCTDERVNKVTADLFTRYRRVQDYANADAAALEREIRSTGFFRNKTKNLIGMGTTVVQRFAGRIPETMEELLELPGVARKTANVLLGTWFGKNEGIVVDTHIGRLSQRLRLCGSTQDDKDAVRIEQDLMQIVPREEWTWFGHALIWHGRKVCTARKPDCPGCALAPHCPSAGKV